MTNKTTTYKGWQKYVQSSLSFVGVAVAVAGLVGPGLALAQPAISAVQASQITATTAVISWQTDVAADSYISYIGANDQEALLSTSDTLVTNHQVTLSGLKPGTVYSFAVNSADSEGDNAAMNGADFTTLASGGVAPALTPAPVPTPTPAPAPSTNPVQGGGLTVPSGLQYQSPAVTTPIYPTGTLAKEHGTIYMLMGKDSVKVPFTTMQAFTGLGYKLKDVRELDLSGFRLPATYFIETSTQQHPWGSIVEKGGTLYYSHVSGMIPIPSMDVFNANGFKKEMIVPMNEADKAVLAEFPVAYVLEVNDDRLQ